MTEVGRDAMPVILAGGDAASGLADMLHQFLEQTLADSPRKMRLARSMSGRAVFQSAEDDELSVRIVFAGDHIELHDAGGVPSADPCIRADFLTIAHLTSGQENPLRLLAERKLKVRFAFAQIPFLWRMLRLMQIESETRRLTPKRLALATAAAAALAGGAYWYLTGAR